MRELTKPVSMATRTTYKQILASHCGLAHDISRRGVTYMVLLFACGRGLPMLTSGGSPPSQRRPIPEGHTHKLSRDVRWREEELVLRLWRCGVCWLDDSFNMRIRRTRTTVLRQHMRVDVCQPTPSPRRIGVCGSVPDRQLDVLARSAQDGAVFCVRHDGNHVRALPAGVGGPLHVDDSKNRVGSKEELVLTFPVASSGLRLVRL